MDEFKPNSHKSKESLEKKVKKAVVTGARTKKKSEIKKFTDIFISDDLQNVKSYVLLDVFIPALKKAISDIVDMLLYGETERTKKSNASKVSYRSFYEKEAKPYQKANVDVDFCYVEVDTRRDAEAILNAMDEIVSTYGVVSVADMYDLAQIEHSFTHTKYGWTDVRNASVVRNRNGYVLKMPKCMPLD